jgi:hypothetical protein
VWVFLCVSVLMLSVLRLERCRDGWNYDDRGSGDTQTPFLRG